jgi:hypothetical protein
MSDAYNLVDVESGNLVGSYRSEREARDVVRAAWRRFGAEGYAGLALVRAADDGSAVLVAEDAAIVDAPPEPIRAAPTRAAS